MNKTINKILLVASLTVILGGFVLPNLFSAAATGPVILGVIIVLGIIAFTPKIIKFLTK